MTGRPQVDIKAGDGITYATESEKLVAFRWRAGEQWYVAGPGHAPQTFDDEQDSVGAFLKIALGGLP